MVYEHAYCGMEIVPVKNGTIELPPLFTHPLSHNVRHGFVKPVLTQSVLDDGSLSLRPYTNSRKGGVRYDEKIDVSSLNVASVVVVGTGVSIDIIANEPPFILDEITQEDLEALDF